MKNFLSMLVVNPVLYMVFPIFLSWLFQSVKVKRALYGVSVVLVLLFTNTPLFKFAEEQWYAAYDQPLSATKTYDYGIILGGYSQWDWKRDRTEYGPAADRLIEGIRLYKMGKIKKIVLASDGSIILKPQKDGPEGNPAGMVKYLNELGVPTEDLILEKYATTTRENVTCTMELLGSKLTSSNSLVITSAVHMRRSLSAFQQEGLHPDCYITDTWPDLNGESESYLPSLYTLAQWQELLHEWVGYVVYKIMGW